MEFVSELQLPGSRARTVNPLEGCRERGHTAPHPEGMQSFSVEWITKTKPFHAAEKDKQKNLTHKTREKLIWVDQMHRVDNAL